MLCRHVRLAETTAWKRIGLGLRGPHVEIRRSITKKLLALEGQPYQNVRNILYVIITDPSHMVGFAPLDPPYKEAVITLLLPLSLGDI